MITNNYWFDLGYNAYLKVADTKPPKDASQEEIDMWWDGWHEAVNEGYSFFMDEH